MDAPELRILTWNIYFGGNHTPLMGATEATLPKATSALWQQVQSTFFPTRARAIAAVIARHQPDFIGLQEVARWSVVGRTPLQRTPLQRTQSWVVYDFSTLLLGELAALGAFYTLAARSPTVDVLLPSAEGFEVHFEDAATILARVPPPGAAITWSNPRAERFSRNFTATLRGQPLTIARPWASVDVQCGKFAARLVNTHIEYADATVSAAQCAELLAGPANAPERSVILVGDFNAQAETAPTWALFQTAGFADAFHQVGKGSGVTWGQAEDLRNPVGKLQQRLDWVLYRAAKAISAQVVGADPQDRTPEGLWPSDHAGVFARIRLQKRQSAR